MKPLLGRSVGNYNLPISMGVHFHILAIHPFQDGNGRLGRALFFLALSQSPDSNLVFLYRLLAIDRQIERNKEEYYAVLQRCSNGQYLTDSTEYRIEFFLVFMLRMLEKALLDIQYYRKRYGTIQLLSDAGRQILQCFKDQPEIKLGTKDLVRLTKLPRRTIVYSTNSLVEGGLLEKLGQARSTRYQLIF